MVHGQVLWFTDRCYGSRTGVMVHGQVLWLLLSTAPSNNLHMALRQYLKL